MDDNYAWYHELKYQIHQWKSTFYLKLSGVFIKVASFFSDAADKHIDGMKEYAAMLKRSAMKKEMIKWITQKESMDSKSETSPTSSQEKSGKPE